MKQYGFSMGQDPMCFSELPEFLHSTFVEAHRSGRLPETLSHYIGTLDGLGALNPLPSKRSKMRGGKSPGVVKPMRRYSRTSSRS